MVIIIIIITYHNYYYISYSSNYSFITNSVIVVFFFHTVTYWQLHSIAESCSKIVSGSKNKCAVSNERCTN